jgi:hypothetical protein
MVAGTMPRISFFEGLAIYMYFDDHPPPHSTGSELRDMSLST